MSPLSAADLDAMLAATGVAVTLGRTTVMAVRAQQGESVLEGGGAGGVTSAEVTYTIRTGTLPGLATGATLTAEGERYQVRDFYPIEDGALTRIHAARSL